MYRTITSRIAAASQFSDPVQIPGKLVGYTFSADADATPQLQFNSPQGWSFVVLNNSIPGANTVAGVVSTTLLSNHLMAGTAEFRIRVTTNQLTERAITWYYEDNPVVYR